MKPINVLQLIASVCLLAGSILNLLELFVALPLGLYLCTGPLLLVAAVLYIVISVRLIRDKKHF